LAFIQHDFSRPSSTRTYQFYNVISSRLHQPSVPPTNQSIVQGHRLALSRPDIVGLAVFHYSLSSRLSFRHPPDLTLPPMPILPSHYSVEGFTSAASLIPDHSGARRSELLFWELKKGVWKPADSITLICADGGNGTYVPLATGSSGDVHPIKPTVSSTFDPTPDNQTNSLYSIAHPWCPKSIKKAVLREAWKTGTFPEPQQCVLLSIQEWPEGEIITSYADTAMNGIVKPCTDLTKAKEAAHGVCAPSLINFKMIDASELSQSASAEGTRSDSGDSNSLQSLFGKARRLIRRG
jgi:hypothetical protein